MHVNEVGDGLCFSVLQEEATKIAEKWTSLLKTGHINAKIYAVDRATIMFILSFGQDTTEVRMRLNSLGYWKLGLLMFECPVTILFFEVVVTCFELLSNTWPNLCCFLR